MFSIVLLALEMQDKETGTFTIVWKNEHPGSTRFCRLMIFTYVGERKETTTSEVAQIQDHITKLKPASMKSGEFRNRCKVTHKTTMTMID